MANESALKETFKRPNILRKRNLGKQESVRNMDFLELAFVNESNDNIEQLTLDDLTIVISSNHNKCKNNSQRSKNITLDSYLCEEYKKRKQTNSTVTPSKSIETFETFSQTNHSEAKDITKSRVQSRLAQGVDRADGIIISSSQYQPPTLSETLGEDNLALDSMSILQDQWLDTQGSSLDEDTLKLSVPLMQIESSPHLSQLSEELNILVNESVDADGMRLIVCPWPSCGRTFRQPCRLREHWRAHTGARPYRCRRTGCLAAFRSASKLRRHVAGGAHEAERRHACPWPACGRAFLRADHLRQHVPRHIRPSCPTRTAARTLQPNAQLINHVSEMQVKEQPVCIKKTTRATVNDEDNLTRPVDPVLLQWQHHSSLLEEGGGCARTHRPWTGGTQSWSAGSLASLSDHHSHMDWLANLDLPVLPDDRLHHALLQEDCALTDPDSVMCNEDLSLIGHSSLDPLEMSHPLFDCSDPGAPY